MPRRALGRALLLAFILGAGATRLVQASGISGLWQTTVDGVTSTLRLTGEPAQLSGSYEEGEIRLTVRGSLRQNQLQLTLVEPNRGIEIGTLRGALTGETIQAVFELSPQLAGKAIRQSVRFVRAEGSTATARSGSASGSSSGPASGPTAGAGAPTDPRLVGAWVNEKIINSGGGAGGFASFNTVRVLQFEASGDVRQWVKSAGGGGNWSYGSGDRLEFSGRWFARDGVIHLQAEGQSAFQPAVRYRFSEAYLVTEGQNGRLIWQRR